MVMWKMYLTDDYVGKYLYTIEVVEYFVEF